MSIHQKPSVENMKFSLIVAYDEKTRGIGFENKMQWNIPEEFEHFKKTTTGKGNNAVIMGMNTWKSLPVKPLPGRRNIVLTRGDVDLGDDAVVFHDIETCVTRLCREKRIDECFIIGGEDIYIEFLKLGVISTCHISVVKNKEEKIYDRFFTEYYMSLFKLKKIRDFERFTINTFHKVNHDEVQYLDLVKKIISQPDIRRDRTGTGTKSIFGENLSFDLSNMKIPLLTTKKTFWRGVVEELLWIISGSTDANVLSDKGVHIWDGNSSREFLDNLGFNDRRVGDVGPVYGFQWRHSGAKYIDCDTDYSGQGTDQLAECIRKIRTDPCSRRILMSAWNVADLDEMNLPPCHLLVQFYVSGKDLSCQLYMRSVDVGLGLPFNVASYSLLTHMLAQCCDLDAKELKITMGDTHLYSDHVIPIMEQLKRTPMSFPTVRLNSDVFEIDDFTSGDIELENYFSYQGIKLPFSA